jgi:NADH-quinone oxidoreductase subunit M
VLTTIATTGVIFAAAYLLWAIQRILFNPLDKRENEHIPDLNWREISIMAPIVALIIWLGVYPAPVLRRTETAAQALVTRVETRGSASIARSSAPGDAGLFAVVRGAQQ